MRIHITNVRIITAKKDGTQYQKVSFVYEDGTVDSALLPLGAGGASLAVDITPEELGQYSAHEAQYKPDFSGRARIESIEVSE